MLEQYREPENEDKRLKAPTAKTAQVGLAFAEDRNTALGKGSTGGEMHDAFENATRGPHSRFARSRYQACVRTGPPCAAARAGTSWSHQSRSSKPLPEGASQPWSVPVPSTAKWDQRGTTFHQVQLRAHGGWQPTKSQSNALPDVSGFAGPREWRSSGQGEDRMRKKDIAVHVAAGTGLTKRDAAAAVNAVFECISGALLRGEEVRVAHFGAFVVSTRATGVGRNVRTGARVRIPPARRVIFRAGTALTNGLNAPGEG